MSHDIIQLYTNVQKYTLTVYYVPFDFGYTKIKEHVNNISRKGQKLYIEKS